MVSLKRVQQARVARAVYNVEHIPNDVPFLDQRKRCTAPAAKGCGVRLPLPQARLVLCDPPALHFFGRWGPTSVSEQIYRDVAAFNSLCYSDDFPQCQAAVLRLGKSERLPKEQNPRTGARGATEECAPVYFLKNSALRFTSEKGLCSQSILGSGAQPVEFREPFTSSATFSRFPSRVVHLALIATAVTGKSILWTSCACEAPFEAGSSAWNVNTEHGIGARRPALWPGPSKRLGKRLFGWEGAQRRCGLRSGAQHRQRQHKRKRRSCTRGGASCGRVWLRPALS
mmetsp:Transcript_11902/g.33665  ORF Transcript_11902/g.33665 Transcript_11902/m.33665 type:complete len:285 (-) Transcript_11902:109-963(-)